MSIIKLPLKLPQDMLLFFVSLFILSDLLGQIMQSVYSYFVCSHINICLINLLIDC